MYNGLESSTTVEVKQDPRLNVSQADLEAQNKLFDQFASNVEVATTAMDQIREAKK